MLKIYKPKEIPEPSELEKIKKEIKQIKKLISCNESFFNLVDNEHLVEYAVHQHNALYARYNHLIAMAKKNQSDTDLPHLVKEGSKCT